MASLQAMKSTKAIRAGPGLWLARSVHLLPISFSAGLLSVNFAQLYWFPASGIGADDNGSLKISTNNILNCLQLAAKLYEILVVASLGTITLEAFKRHLINDGIPFGLLTGAYRISDIMYLLSPRFWAAAPRALCLAALLLSSVILSALLGPASAILIIPKLGWFPLSNPFSSSYPPVGIMAEPKMLWPTVLNESSLWPVDDCTGYQAVYRKACPSGGFPDIFAWADGWSSWELPNNITFHDGTGVTSRRLDIYPQGSRGSFLTTPTEIAMNALGLFKAYIKSNDIGDISHAETYRLHLKPRSAIFQPLVNAKCNVWSQPKNRSISDIPDIHYPYSELRCFSNNSEDDCHRMRNQIQGQTVPKSVWMDDKITWDFSLIEGKNSSQKSHISSLVFYLGAPYLNNGQIGKRAIACSYMAHWIPSVVNIGSNYNDLVESNVTDLGVFSSENWVNNDKPDIVGSVIRMEKPWLPLINPALTNENGNKSTSNNTADSQSSKTIAYLFENLKLWTWDETDTWFLGPGSSINATSTKTGEKAVQELFEKLTGALITDAISRLGMPWGPMLLHPGASEDKSIVALSLRARKGSAKVDLEVFQNGTIKYPNGSLDSPPRSLEGFVGLDFIMFFLAQIPTMSFEVERFGYGYGKPGGAMTFALVVIFAYIATVFINWFIVAYQRADSVAIFSDVQDLVTLAWSSPASTKLYGQGLGTGRDELFKNNVVVRSTLSNSVTMVFDNDKQDMGLSRLKRGEEYM